jgi:hypothetical protein
MFPIILIHQELPHLQWICTLNDEDEVESVLVNQYTKEIEKRVILEEEVQQLLNEFRRNGWTKGYIPDINILNDGEIVQTVSVNQSVV